MDLAAFCETYTDHLRGIVRSVAVPAWAGLLVRFECHEPAGWGGRVVYEFACRGVREVRFGPELTSPDVESVDLIDALIDAHPLLLDYTEPHDLLHFDAPPADPDGVVGALYRAHRAVLGRWRPLSDTLNAADSLAQHLALGSGLLASGPRPVVDALEAAVRGRLPVHRTAGRPPAATVPRLLLFDHAWVIADRIELCPSIFQYGAAVGGLPPAGETGHNA